MIKLIQKRRGGNLGEVVGNPRSPWTAAGSNCRAGVVQRAGQWVWIPGENQWVTWAELSRQVTEAFENWKIKRVMRGLALFDGFDLRQRDIRYSGVRGRARREYLKDWHHRHLGLCRLAEVQEESAA